ncbi:MCE family protein [Thermomonospora cellulosilytica]|uniref:Phospholipid/cholesterol/gamma-HCH transport system substrate-binding protein n=1 Tax=Thermomonospora cellulosilytica TaxID=1411118 RepID=A0A7W3MW88_9ACTN|nr:MlaD family protein [Thermomonospora cellulosilytica]MBA9002947.1 phospholipid/cholesterol/gamma-HCH transport system substrate-binding protein [Thermomonospora cellulosilytica]
MNAEDLPLGRRLVIAAITLAAVAALTWTLVTEPFAPEGTRLTAEFGRAGQGLSGDAPVKIRGVDVGRVTGVELTAAGRARVTMAIDPGVRVPDTVTAVVEPSSVFGPKYVNLLPGAHERQGPFLASGAHIARTADPRDLSDLLGDVDSALAAIDPDEVAVIMNTLAQGLGGQGPRIRRTIDQSEVLLNVAHRHRHDARVFLADGADLVTTVAGFSGEVVAITGDANTLITGVAAGGEDRLGSFADRLAELSALVAHGFDRRGGQLGAGFRSGERAVGIIYRQLPGIGDAVRTGNQILPIYGELTTIPGPDGKHYMGVHGWLPNDPCALIVGLCGPGGAGR